MDKTEKKKEPKKEPRKRKPRAKKVAPEKKLERPSTLTLASQHIYTSKFYGQTLFAADDFHAMAFWSRHLWSDGSPGAFLVVLRREQLLVESESDVADGISAHNDTQIADLRQAFLDGDNVQWKTVSEINAGRRTPIDTILGPTETEDLMNHDPYTEYCVLFVSIEEHKSACSVVKYKKGAIDESGSRGFFLRHIHTCQQCYSLENHKEFLVFLKTPEASRHAFRRLLQPCKRCNVYFFCPSTDDAHNSARKAHNEICEAVLRGIREKTPSAQARDQLRRNMVTYQTENLTEKKEKDAANPLERQMDTPVPFRALQYAEFCCLYQSADDRNQFRAKFGLEALDTDVLIERLKSAGFLSEEIDPAAPKRRARREPKKGEKASNVREDVETLFAKLRAAKK